MGYASWWHQVWFAVIFNLQWKCTIKTTYSCKHIFEFLLRLLCNLCTCPPVSVLTWTWKEVFYFDVAVISDHWMSIITCTSISDCVTLHMCFSILFLVCTAPTVFLLICSIDFCASIVLKLIVKMDSSSLSDIPNNAGPFPGTTKDLLNICLFLWLIFTLQMSYCGIFILLWVF